MLAAFFLPIPLIDIKSSKVILPIFLTLPACAKISLDNIFDDEFLVPVFNKIAISSSLFRLCAPKLSSRSTGLSKTGISQILITNY